MENATSPVYSADGPQQALALRRGPPAALRAALLETRERTLRLAEDFRSALGDQPHLPYIAEVNPPLWELGHLAWFQEWWIARNPERHRGVNAQHDAARAASLLPQADAWYDSSRVAHRTRWELPLPHSDATSAYLQSTLAGTLELLDRLPQGAGDDALYFFRLATLHEQMHNEAAVFMAQMLGIPLRDAPTPSIAVDAGELAVGPTRFRLGADGDGFAFDNELSAQEVELPAFRIDAEPLTWGAFLPFVEAGGYQEPQVWTEAGWHWLQRLPARAPQGLRRTATGWERMHQGAWRPLRDDEVAVHLSAHEADAWCAWAGRRLPTEAEWECAAYTAPGFRWGRAWEWTASPFTPYPGFAPHPYRDYSQPWFHTRRVLRGASPATSAGLAHARYRNFFEPHRRDVIAGFRTVRAD